MKITLKELKSRSDPTIGLVELVSVEGRYYLARLHVDGAQKILTDKHGEPLLYTGVAAAEEALSAFPITQTDVLPPGGYEEMVGMNEDEKTEMRVPTHRGKG
ncbi:MAG: hypothetical protein KGY54_01855 [Oleiphilaceae bacterium]|nr:hypothetical protein [Oleiphilaceae bacterium]